MGRSRQTSCSLLLNADYLAETIANEPAIETKGMQQAVTGAALYRFTAAAPAVC
jgi:hypothetical protein